MSPARRIVALVAAREVRERAGGRAFLLSTLFLTTVIVAAVIVPAVNDTTAHFRVGLTGATPPALTTALRDAAQTDAARLTLRAYPSLAAGETAVRDRRAGVLIVDGHRLVWRAEPDPRLAGITTTAIQQLGWSRRAAALGLSPAQAAALSRPAAIPARQLEALDPDRDSRETIAMIGFLLLLTTVIFYGNAVAEGVAQEKGGRIMEVLLSRVRAQELLAGKVLGIGATGLAQVSIATAAGAVAMLTVSSISVPAAIPTTLAMTVLWFALGYAFWSVAFAAAGALVSRVEDLASVTTPLSLALMLCAFSAVVVQDAPDAWWIRLASFVPLTSPFVMPARAALGHVAPWEIGLAVAIMVAATYTLVRLAAAVYAGGVLRTGERPRLGELWHAARAR
jgi:ABC-2 type transport system permease protein